MTLAAPVLQGLATVSVGRLNAERCWKLEGIGCFMDIYVGCFVVLDMLAVVAVLAVVGCY